jgi:hypothetical protein
MIHTDEYTIRLRDDLPSSVPAFIAESPDGHINIYLNSRLNHDQQREGLKHEIDHYERDDLHNGLDIHIVEADRCSEKRDLPPVFRASQLLTNANREPTLRFDIRCKPKPSRHIPPEAIRPTPIPPTYRQRKIIMQALNELDRCFFDNDLDLENRMILGDDY